MKRAILFCLVFVLVAALGKAYAGRCDQYQRLTAEWLICLRGGIQLPSAVVPVNQTSCSRIDTGWKPKLPLDFPGIGKMYLADLMAFGGIGCRMCHDKRGLKFPTSNCASWIIHRDGRWATGGTEHTRHQKAGVICLDCHNARAR